jgi:hypothetical protein
MYSVDNITFYLRFKRQHFFKRGVEARSSVEGYFGILAPIFFRLSRRGLERAKKHTLVCDRVSEKLHRREVGKIKPRVFGVIWSSE